MKNLMVLNLAVLYLNIGLSLLLMDTQWLGIGAGVVGVSSLYFLNGVR